MSVAFKPFSDGSSSYIAGFLVIIQGNLLDGFDLVRIEIDVQRMIFLVRSCRRWRFGRVNDCAFG